MTTSSRESLLPLGREVPFSDIELALGRSGLDDQKRAPGRALTATIVVVGPHDTARRSGRCRRAADRRRRPRHPHIARHEPRANDPRARSRRRARRVTARVPEQRRRRPATLQPSDRGLVAGGKS